MKIAAPGRAAKHDRTALNSDPAAPDPLTRASFGTIAQLLADLGYEPVPIRPGSKAPVLRRLAGRAPSRASSPASGRRRHRDRLQPVGHRDSDQDHACARSGRPRPRNRQAPRSALPRRSWRRGHAPIRFGAPPKALLPFCAAEPFDKITSRWFALPGEDWTVAGFRGHRVEILGAGQQFVAFGRHPRGTFYRWTRGSLLHYHASTSPRSIRCRPRHSSMPRKRSCSPLG